MGLLVVSTMLIFCDTRHLNGNAVFGLPRGVLLGRWASRVSGVTGVNVWGFISILQGPKKRWTVEDRLNHAAALVNLTWGQPPRDEAVPVTPSGAVGPLDGMFHFSRAVWSFD